MLLCHTVCAFMLWSNWLSTKINLSHIYFITSFTNNISHIICHNLMFCYWPVAPRVCTWHGSNPHKIISLSYCFSSHSSKQTHIIKEIMSSIISKSICICACRRACMHAFWLAPIFCVQPERIIILQLCKHKYLLYLRKNNKYKLCLYWMLLPILSRYEPSLNPVDAADSNRSTEPNVFYHIVPCWLFHTSALSK